MSLTLHCHHHVPVLPLQTQVSQAELKKRRAEDQVKLFQDRVKVIEDKVKDLEAQVRRFSVG